MKIYSLFFLLILLGGFTVAAGGKVVAVILEDAVSHGIQGNTVTITHSITNRYSLPLEKINITDEIPNTATITHVSQAYTHTNGKITLSFQNLKPSETKTFTYAYTLPAGKYVLRTSENTYTMNFEKHTQIPKTLTVEIEPTNPTSTNPTSDELLGPAYAIIILGALYMVIK